MYLLSIIIPVYNAERYIDRCATSLFEQTLKHIEFIFVDDCSTDAGMQVLCDTLMCHKNRIPDVKIIRHARNAGISAARNTGLFHATGEYIGWVDSDDWVKPEMFAKLCFEAEKECTDVAWGDFYHVYVDSLCVEVQNEENRLEIIRKLLLGTRHGNLWSGIAKRELYTQYNIRFPQNINIMEDKYVLVQLMYFAKKTKHVSGAYYYYNKCNFTSTTAMWGDFQVPHEAVLSLNSIVNFIESTELEKVLKHEIIYARLILKKSLLNTLSMNAYMNWKNLFTQENRYILKCPNMTVKQKVLGWCIDHNWWFMARIWICFKMYWLNK